MRSEEGREKRDLKVAEARPVIRIEWELTDEDKAFLRSCNIDPR